MNIILFEKNTNSIEKETEEYKHIKNILKLKEGDTFKYGVFNSCIYLATITSFTKENIIFTSKVIEEKETASFLYPVTIVLGSLRPICLKRMLRQISSIGVESIIIYNGDLSEKSYIQSKFYQEQELFNIVLDGIRQSGKTGITKIKVYDDLESVIKDNSEKHLYFCDNKIKADDILETCLSFPLLFAIGSERGFSDKERDLFLRNNFKVVSLGNRILRSETASIATSLILTRRYDGTHNSKR